MSHVLLRRKAVAVSMVVALLTLVSSLPAHAQSGRRLGVVDEPQADVRAAAGQRFYRIGQVEQGDFIVIEEVVFGWGRVRLEGGDYRSLIRKRDVDRRGDGTWGVVNGEATLQSVNLEVDELDPVRNSYLDQGSVEAGTRVEILEEVGEFFLIEAPESAHGFVYMDDMRPASNGEIARFEAGAGNVNDAMPAPTPPTPSPTELANDTTPAPEVVEPEVATPATPQREPDVAVVVPDAETVVPELPGMEDVPLIDEEVLANAGADSDTATDTATDMAEAEGTGSDAVELAGDEQTQDDAQDQTGDAADTDVAVTPAPEAPRVPLRAGGEDAALAYLEAQTVTLFTRPVREQPLDEMQTAYETIAARSDISQADQELIASRLATIERNRNLVASLERLEAARTQPAQQQLTLVPDPEPELVEANAARGPATYTQVGILEASSVYNGRTLPLLYRIVDPASRAHRGFVDPSVIVNPEQLLGNLVGIEGYTERDRSLGRDVIIPTRVDLLTGDANTSAAE